MKNIALITSSQNAYSETFIQAHKKFFDAKVFYYYNDGICLENEGQLKLSKLELGLYGLKCLFNNSRFSSKVLTETAILKSFKKHRIDKVYAEYGPVGTTIMPVCKKMNLPLIVNFHGYDASVRQVLTDCEKQYRELFEYAEYIVAVSKLMKNRLIAMGAPSEKTVYTPCAPNDSFFNIEPAFAENAFVAIGRFVDKKAPYYTILAFKKVLDKFPDAKLYMCGDGLLHSMCVNLVDYFKMSDSVVFCGSVQLDFLKQLYGKVVGFVQHSITASNGDMEGTPVAVLEASAAGLPVVATKHAGIPDVIQHEKTGLLVEEHDVDTMATYMTALLEDRNYARALGQAGKALIKSDFSMERHIGILNNLLYK